MTKQLNVIEFGRQLVETGDLDPIYIMLAEAKKRRVLSETQLRQWCLAYWMFYDAGVATALCTHNPGPFWHLSMEHAGTPSSKRGTERRHFRGGKAVEAVATLAARYPDPADAVYSLVALRKRGEPAQTFADVSARVMKWPQFGPWIAWKVADMMERVLRIPIDFSGAALDMYDEPAKGALIVAYQMPGQPGQSYRNIYPTWQEFVGDNKSIGVVRHGAMEKATAYLTSKLGQLSAPPFYDRPLNIQELETVMCKYKSYLGGHYPVGKDTREIRHTLTEGEFKSALAVKLANYLPGGIFCG